MQKLTPEVIRQLNNLGGGFPPAPSSSNNEPQNTEQWILGDWTFECRVRPGVSALVDLPPVDNTLGDVRFVIGLGAWYWWDGAVWQLASAASPATSQVVTFPTTASALGTTQSEVGSVKLPFVVGTGAVGCECLVFSAAPTRARIIVTDVGTVPIFYGSFVENTPATGFRVVTPSSWPAPRTGWVRLGLDQIHSPLAQVSLRGVSFVPS